MRRLRGQGWWLLPITVLIVVAGLVLLLWTTISSLHTAVIGCPADNGKGQCQPAWAINLGLPTVIVSGLVLAGLARLGIWKWREWFGGSPRDPKR